MDKKIFCKKLKREGTALTEAPFPGPMGERILAEISQEAWQGWLEFQTMLINENRLDLLKRESKDFIKAEREKYLFSDDECERPSGYVPVDK